MRQFTKAELTETITTGQYQAMSPADRAAFDSALIDLWAANYSAQCTADFNADQSFVGSYRRFQLGE